MAVGLVVFKLTSTVYIKNMWLVQLNLFNKDGIENQGWSDKGEKCINLMVTNIILNRATPRLKLDNPIFVKNLVGFFLHFRSLTSSFYY